MNSRHHKSIVLGAISAGAAALLFTLIQHSPRQRDEVSSNAVAAIAISAAPVSRAPASLAIPQKSSIAAQAASTYFHRELAGRPAVDRIYRSVLNRLPPGDDSELLAVYVAEGIARNASPEFAKFMRDLHQGLSDRSRELFDLLNSQVNALRQDAYTYQMSLNLAARLSLPGDLKARLLGDAMNTHFATDPATGVTAMTANITNALILMKNNGITAAQAQPYIQRGIAVNSDDPQALSEFAARANTYYPGSVATK